jgi:hypothetical protein
MKSKIITLSFLFVGFLTTETFCAAHFIFKLTDHNVAASKVRIICTYTFDGIKDEMQLERLKAELSSIQNVEGVKSYYKPEKGAAQLIVSIVENQRTSEADVTFDITLIKKAIIAHGFNPIDVIITEEILK